MDQRGLVQNLEDLGQRGLLVGLLHCRQLARQARRGGFEDLPLRIALLRRIVGAARPGDVLAFYLYEPDLEQRAIRAVRTESR